MTKTNSFKCLCLAVAMLAASLGTQAQKLEISGYFNGFLPTGEFNDPVDLQPLGYFVPINRSTIATGASTGLGASARVGMWLDVGSNHWLLPYVEVSFLWNSTKSSLRDVYDINTKNDSLQSTPSAPNYFNVPILLGLKYRYDLTEIIKPFGEMSIGYDLMFISSNGYKNVSWAGSDKYMHYSYKPNGGMAWSIGAGTYLGENVSVGLYYLSLGSHRIDYAHSSYRGEDDGYSVEKRKIGEFALRIGFHF